MTETRQQRRQRERVEERVEEKAAKKPETLAEKESFLMTLVTKLSLNNTRTLTQAEQERIEILRGGFQVALDGIVEQAKHAEFDLKIAAIQEEIDIYKNGIKTD